MRAYRTKVQYHNPGVSPNLMAGEGEYSCIHATGLSQWSKLNHLLSSWMTMSR
jgi:hypothetical protein